MKRIIFTIIISVIFVQLSFAQYKTVVFDYDKGYFERGDLLPAESNIMLTGTISPLVQMVEVQIFDKASAKKELYSSFWTKEPSSSINIFSVPLNYPLKNDSKYTFSINYYRFLTKDEYANLQIKLKNAIHAYISNNIRLEKNSIEITKNTNGFISDLNSIITNGLSLYKNRLNIDFPGFSDIVKDNVNSIERLNLHKAKFNIINKNDENNQSEKIVYANSQIEQLEKSVLSEINNYLETGLMILFDRKVVIDYQTEKLKNIMTFNVGYGEVYNSGTFSNMSTASSPYISLALPMGKSVFASKIWSRSSINVGVMFQDLEFSPTNIATGPIVSRPFFIGLGYKPISFISISVNALVLESKSGTSTPLDFSKIYIRPMVGISLSFNLWLGLNK